jgi:hypothetical protein
MIFSVKLPVPKDRFFYPPAQAMDSQTNEPAAFPYPLILAFNAIQLPCNTRQFPGEVSASITEANQVISHNKNAIL